MNNDRKDRRRPRWTENLDLALYGVLTLWVIHLANFLLPFMDFRAWGIRPRSLAGLTGIVLMPFLHGDLAHLVSNTLGLLILLVLVLSLGRSLAVVSSAIIIVLCGIVVWLFGRADGCYIGASGLVFGLISFLFIAGVVRREWRSFVIAVVVLLLYGGSLVALVRPEPGTSWLAHASGFGAGIVAAWWTRGIGRRGR